MITSTSDDCTGMMAFWADIDADWTLQFQQWHNCEHIPERVSIPGFVEGRRYRAMDNRPRFLMYYDTLSSSVLSSDIYFSHLNSPTIWTREAVTHFRNPTRDVFSRIGIARGASNNTFAASYIASLRFDLRPEQGRGKEIENLYVTQWLQTAAGASENIQRVRLYVADREIGNIRTSESKVHGGAPGEQKYLVLVEHALPPAITENEGPIFHADKVVFGGDGHRHNEDFHEYWLEIATTKSDVKS